MILTRARVDNWYLDVTLTIYAHLDQINENDILRYLYNNRICV